MTLSHFSLIIFPGVKNRVPSLLGKCAWLGLTETLHSDILLNIMTRVITAKFWEYLKYLDHCDHIQPIEVNTGTL